MVMSEREFLDRLNEEDRAWYAEQADDPDEPLVTLELLNQIIEEAGFVGTMAAVAYLNHILEPIMVDLERMPLITFDMWLSQYKSLLGLELDSNLNRIDLNALTMPQLIAWLTHRIVATIIDDVPNGYSTDRDEVVYEALTLTPWDLALGIGQNIFLTEIIPFKFHQEQLPVNVVVNGNAFTHLMTMDVAMGLLLVSQTAGVDFEMSMYGAPLAYFIGDQDDVYSRYEDYATEGELRIRMVGDERWYYFFDTDFLRGIKTGAEWLGVDHHDFWELLQDTDRNPWNFF